MSAWIRRGDGTFARQIKRARKARRCVDCGRELKVGEPYVEHRAAPWSEHATTRAYSLASCGLEYGSCRP